MNQRMGGPEDIAFRTIDWKSIPREEHKGVTSTSWWQVVQLPGLRIRLVEYEAGYVADHWCQKGHIIHCLEGDFLSEMQNGEPVQLSKGMSYVVSDELSSHRSISASGVRLLIIDGDFLKLKTK